jgi:hypothetical protein
VPRIKADRALSLAHPVDYSVLHFAKIRAIERKRIPALSKGGRLKVMGS